MTPDDLRVFRVSHKLPQAVLADVLGISRHAIIDMEKGRRAIPLWMGLALAAYEVGLAPYSARGGSKGGPGRVTRDPRP